jgi:hypothetical protein
MAFVGNTLNLGQKPDFDLETVAREDWNYAWGYSTQIERRSLKAAFLRVFCLGSVNIQLAFYTFGEQWKSRLKARKG